jgi:hypothetical protein
MGSTTEVRFPAGGRDFLLHNVHIESLQWTSRVKGQGNYADRILPSAAELKKSGAIPPHTRPFMIWCLLANLEEPHVGEG